MHQEWHNICSKELTKKQNRPLLTMHSKRTKGAMQFLSTIVYYFFTVCLIKGQVYLGFYMADILISTLEKCRQQAIHNIRYVCNDEELLNVAIAEIELNALSAANWLHMIRANGFTVNNDLSRIDGEYIANREYRRLINHLEHHLWEIESTIRAVRKGLYIPKLAKYV